MKMYSIEFIPKWDKYNCWNQHGLTSSRVLATLYKVEVRLRFWHTARYRTRVL